MYLKTPKKYTSQGRRRYLFTIRRRAVIFALISAIIGSVIVILLPYRHHIVDRVQDWANRNIRIELNPPTPTPTIPASDLRLRYISFVQSGNINNAISSLASLGDVLPNDVGVHALHALWIMLRGDPDDTQRHAQALAAAEKTVNADPEAADGWIMLGLAHNLAGKPQEALAYLLRARDLDPKNPMLLAVLGDTYNLLDDPTAAQSIISEAIEVGKVANPVNVTALAYAYVVQGNLSARTSGEEAIRAYEEAWRIASTDPTVPRGYIAQWIASYYLNRADADLAIPVLNEAIDRDKDDPINPYLLGRIYLNQGDPNQARAALERCRDIDPNQIKCLRWLGTVLYRAQNYQRAAELANQAIALGSEDPAVYLVAGLSYALLNRCPEALPLLMKGMELDQTRALASQFQDGIRQCGGAAPPPVATGAP